MLEAGHVHTPIDKPSLTARHISHGYSMRVCRDCAALASNGELSINDLATYKAQYIDAIAAAIRAKAGTALRVVAVVEPDSLCVLSASPTCCWLCALTGRMSAGRRNPVRCLLDTYRYSGADKSVR